MALLRRAHPAAPVLAAFLVGALLAASLTRAVVAPRPGDLVKVDERHGTVGLVAADRSAFVLRGIGSYRVFTTRGVGNLRPGERVVVGLLHVSGADDVPLYIRPQG
jgi:hypothetical protein